MDTTMDYVLAALNLLGALGLLIYGMRMMSDALQKMAGPQLRHILERMTTNRFTGMFTLCVPDEEVRQDLATLTTSIVARQDTAWVSQLGDKLLNAEWDEFFIGLKSLYASLPYGSKEESVHEFSFERNLVVLLWSQGIRCTTEDRQASGQADVVAVHPCGVFIFELKVNESAEAALKQVRDKQYDVPYRGRGLPIWLIGLNFDRQSRHLLDAKAEKL